MQRLIDADKTMKMIEEAKVSDEKSRNFAENIIRFSETVLTIPDNPTNGDMINSILDVDKDCVDVHGENGTMTFTVSQEWWNAPYKENKDGKIDR